MAEQVAEVIAEPELAASVVEDLEDLERIYLEFKDEQISARQRILVLLDDYEASKEDILLAFEAYNNLRSETLLKMQEVGQNIRAAISADEWENMENEIQNYISRIISL